MDHSSMKMNNDEHNGHSSNHIKSMNKKFWIALILTIPIILLEPLHGFESFNNKPNIFSEIIVLILGSIIYFYCGEPFFQGAKPEFKNKKPGMMSLITLGITVAYFYSIYAFLANNVFEITSHINNFWGELATLIDIMLLGHLIEMRSISASGSAVDALAKLLPDNAELVDSKGGTKSIPINQIKVSDVLRVKPGEKVPADGLIVKGATSINESLVTGESKLINKGINDKVIGGSINGNGTFELKVTQNKQNSYLSKVMHLIDNAQGSKTVTQNLANRIAGYLFYAALIIAILAFIYWIATKGINFALPIAVTVLITACPHALGLAIPLVISRSTGIAAKNGLLIRNQDSLEKSNKLKYALLDKTGTLTQGQFVLNYYHSFNPQFTDLDILSIAAGLEKQSNHPLAKGVLAKASEQSVEIPDVSDVQQKSGIGLSGTINNQKYQLVSINYVIQKSIEYDQSVFNDVSNQGNSVSFLIQNNQVIGMIGEGDQIKENSPELINYLKQIGIKPVMLTGDNANVTQSIANRLGITDYQAGLLPEDKEKLVVKFQEQGEVLFIGDGVNDAPSLSRANLGIAIGSGTDIAIESADVVLVNSDPKSVISLLKLTKKARNKMVQNLWWGAGYNIVALPLAAGILAPIGIILSPMAGAILMSISTIIVAVNAMTLKI